jgi:hypothetical protein
MTNGHRRRVRAAENLAPEIASWRPQKAEQPHSWTTRDRFGAVSCIDPADSGGVDSRSDRGIP